MSNKKITVYVVELDLFTETYLVSTIQVNESYYKKARRLLPIFKSKRKANAEARKLNRLLKRISIMR